MPTGAPILGESGDTGRPWLCGAGPLSSNVHLELPSSQVCFPHPATHNVPRPEIKVALLTESASVCLLLWAWDKKQAFGLSHVGPVLSGQWRGPQEPGRAEGSISVRMLGDT